MTMMMTSHESNFEVVTSVGDQKINFEPKSETNFSGGARQMLWLVGWYARSSSRDVQCVVVHVTSGALRAGDVQRQQRRRPKNRRAPDRFCGSFFTVN
jgi:hypothetical protein